jgi:hypothetical protein
MKKSKSVKDQIALIKEKEELFRGSKRSVIVESNDTEAILANMQHQLSMLAEAQSENTNKITNGIDSVQKGVDVIDDTTNKTLETAVTGFETQKQLYKEQKKMLEKMSKDIENIPRRYGCSSSSIVGLLKCIISLAEFVIGIIRVLLYVYYVLTSYLKDGYKSIVPFKICTLMLDALLYWFHGYFIYLIITAIGIKIGNDKLASDAFVMAVRFAIKSISLLKSFAPIDAMRNSVTYFPQTIHYEIINSEFKTEYEFGYNYTMIGVKTINETYQKLNSIGEYASTLQQYTNIGDLSVSDNLQYGYEYVGNTSGNVYNYLGDKTESVYDTVSYLTKTESATAIADGATVLYSQSINKINGMVESIPWDSLNFLKGGYKHSSRSRSRKIISKRSQTRTRSGGTKKKSQIMPLTRSSIKNKMPLTRSSIKNKMPLTRSSIKNKMPRNDDITKIEEQLKKMMTSLETPNKKKNKPTEFHHQLVNAHVQLSEIMLAFTLNVAGDAIHLSHYFSLLKQ